MTAIIFDLDGTLIDSAPDIHAAVNRMLAEAGRPALSLAMVRSFIGNGVPVLVDRVRAAVGEPENAPRRADMIACFMQHYEAASADLTQLYPNVLQALNILRAAGYPMGLCTNKPEAAARDILRAFGLDSFFLTVIGGDTLPQRKPHPAPLLAASQALRARELGGATTLYVGDSEVDAETAAAAAVPLILFTEGYRKSPVSDLRHAALFSDFAALPALIGKLAHEVATQA